MNPSGELAKLLKKNGINTSADEILNSANRFAEVAATGAFIHDRAARLASKGGPISASSIIEYVPEAIRKILG